MFSRIFSNLILITLRGRSPAGQLGIVDLNCRLRHHELVRYISSSVNAINSQLNTVACYESCLLKNISEL